MHRRVRTFIFFIFLGIFLIGAPGIVLYTAGYRINGNTWKVQQTGVIAMSTIPRGASILLDGALMSSSTPYVAQRLSPNNYTVTLAKNGYHSWEQSVAVNSGSTTYVTAVLFADASPELLLEEQALSVTGDKSGRFIDVLVQSSNGKTKEIWRYDTVTHLQHNITTVSSLVTNLTLSHDESVLLLDGDPTIPAVNIADGRILSLAERAVAESLLPEYSFFDNGSNTEMRSTSDQSLVTLLPSSVYTPVFRSSTIAILRDSRKHAYLVNLSSHNVTQIDIPTDILSASSSENLLGASDGSEISVYDPQNGDKTLLVRQSDPVLALSWHSSDRVLLFATSSKILAIERDKYETHEITTLLDNATIVNMWPDATGKMITFFGTVNGITGIWRLGLAV